MHLAAALLLTSLVVLSGGYQHFRYRIPNGEHVIHPCFEANVLWYGVGHKNPLGGGERNAFGLDFVSQGYKWTRCLCEMDSDGDGMTNGQELGDPDCTWSEGQVPARSTSITHPGVCTPMDVDGCSADNLDFVVCSDPTDFDCDAINEEHVQNISLSFPQTPVPAEATTYKCMAFELPDDGDYHLIAAAPHIDNDIVMHHIVVYGCAGSDEESNALANYAEPADCGMTECDDFVVAWTLGIQGQCFDEEYGVRMGTNGYRVVVMEYHWNNPEYKSDYTDATSMTLYYTANKRQYDAGILFIGPSLVMVPPGFESYDVEGDCSAECLQDLFNGTMVIAEIIPHMHYLGSGFKLELIHDGAATVIYEQPRYFYDNPDIYKLDVDVNVGVGDELRVTCTYTSKNKAGYTYWGEATTEEMCYAIIVYYPYVVSETCAMTNGYGYCPTGSESDISAVCDFGDFLGLAALYGDAISAVCDPTGISCYGACESAIQPLTTHSCWTSAAGPFFKSGMLYHYLEFVQMLSSCDEKPTVVAGDVVSDDICPDDEGMSVMLMRIESYVLISAALLLRLV